MPDRVCIRGCTVRGVHFATCADFGKTEDGTCRGCAPATARASALVCDRCFRRFRGLLLDAPDLVGRLRSLADPGKSGWNWDRQVTSGSATEPPAPVPADLLDAVRDIQGTLRSWSVYLDGRHPGRTPSDAVAAYDDAHGHAMTILADLDVLVNDRDKVLQLAAGVLDVHEPDETGERAFWSIADAMAKYGAERRDRSTRPRYEEPEVLSDEERKGTGIPEWDDRLLSREEAELEAGSPATLRRWKAKGEIQPEGEIHIAGVRTTIYRLSTIRATRERLAANSAANLSKRPNHPNRTREEQNCDQGNRSDRR